MALENTLLNSAKRLNYEEQLAILEEPCYKEDFWF